MVRETRDPGVAIGITALTRPGASRRWLLLGGVEVAVALAGAGPLGWRLGVYPGIAVACLIGLLLAATAAATFHLESAETEPGASVIVAILLAWTVGLGLLTAASIDPATGTLDATPAAILSVSAASCLASAVARRLVVGWLAAAAIGVLAIEVTLATPGAVGLVTPVAIVVAGAIAIDPRLGPAENGPSSVRTVRRRGEQPRAWVREPYVGDPAVEAHEAIRSIVAERRFNLVFQPVMDLPTGRAVGFEALTRFTDGTPPQPVFNQAERLGLGLDLEEATLRAAVAGSIELPERAWLSLNLSPAFVLSGRPARILAGHRRPLVLELTEHVAVDDYPALRLAIADLGPSVRLAVDDAGAGFASLRHVLELDPDIIKLDLALIQGIDGDESRQALLASLCHFARRTNCRLLAEGIETEAELETVRSIGIGLGQGFLLGVPAPIGVAVAATAAAQTVPQPRPRSAVTPLRPSIRAGRRNGERREESAVG